MKYEDYSKIKQPNGKDCITQSVLGKFKTNPNALAIGEKTKSNYDCQLGNALEKILMNELTMMGSSYTIGTKLSFNKHFFVADMHVRPKDEIIQWILDGEDLSKKYIQNKDGSMNKKHASFHKFLDLCSVKKGRIPIIESDYEKMVKLVHALFDMEVNGLSVEGKPVTYFQIFQIIYFIFNFFNLFF